MKSIALLACVLLAGCQSMRDFAHEHPMATTIGAALLIGSVAASLDNGSDKSPPAENPAIGGGPGCTPQPNGSCR